MKYFPMPAHPAQGLYHPAHEHDACGVGFVAHIKGQANHTIIEQGLKILENLDHRGAVGADTLMGDGAGILIQIPDKLYQEEMYQQNIVLPPIGEYGVGMVFLPKEHASRQACIEELERVVNMERQHVIGWRDVPVNHNLPMSPTVLATAPVIRQIFIGRGRDIMTTDAFERKLYIIRVRANHAIRRLALHHGKEYFVPSMSARTVIYKGLLLAHQVGAYYTDLLDQRTISAFAIVHQRFSTNTFPAWQLAHPYRMIAHNGEINTIKGNVNWINARTESIASPVLGEDLRKLWPLIYPEQSDTACFDNCLELLTMSGYQLPQAMMMMIPEAWEHHTLMDDKHRAFYEYHAAMMEPWDGPAAMIFTDGKQIGATLDRNGLRPARFYITRDDLVIMASEAGVLRIEQQHIAYKGRLRPGKMFLLDMELGHIIDDKTLKNIITNIKPYKAWVETVRIKLDDMTQQSIQQTLTPINSVDSAQEPDHSGLQNDPDKYSQQKFCKAFAYSFGYSDDELSALQKFAQCQTQQISYPHNNTLAILSEEHRLLFDYFNQLVAQATNPPIDAQHESVVMSLVSFIGPKPNLLDINNINPPMRLEVVQPILDFASMEKINHIARYTRGKFCSYRLNLCYPVIWGKEGIEARIASLCAEAVDAVQSNYNILILSDRNVDSDHVAIPILLATSAIHQHLVSVGLRTSTGIVVETAAARTAHHFALLGGYGAEAIHPYLAMQILAHNIGQDNTNTVDSLNQTTHHIIQKFISCITVELKHVMSQAGISTYLSYTGSQMFEAIGLSRKVVNKYFKGTLSHIDGLDIFDIASEALALHESAFSKPTQSAPAKQATHKMHALVLRDLLHPKRRELSMTLPFIEIEPAEKIMQRFIVNPHTCTHQSIPLSSNHLGQRKIQTIDANRTQLTLDKLAQADLIEIKIAHHRSNQDAHISPHHDIYSIEDLAQLIYDLKNVNPKAEIATKLVSQIGIGTVAAGIAKAKADLIIISGHDAKHIQHQLCVDQDHIASPWEIGLAEIQQTLVINNLRGRVRLQVEGQFDNGRDIVIAALLGAELFSFNVFPNTIFNHANSHEDIKNYFLLIAEEVRGWLSQLGLRRLDDLIGRADLLERNKNIFIQKSKSIDLSGLLHQPTLATHTPHRQISHQEHALEHVLDQQFIPYLDALHQPLQSNFSSKIEDIDERATVRSSEKLHNAADKVIRVVSDSKQTSAPTHIKQVINNSHRAIGTFLSGEIARRFQTAQLFENALYLHMTGTAGQSFGAFLAHGVTLDLEGDANDYVGKGLSGGRIIVRVPHNFYAEAKHNIIVGNTVLYGATCGTAFFNGIAGERFATCNAGAIAVVEGVGDHACECMTEGTIVVLGNTGRNFAAGMSGGIAYVYDEDGLFKLRCNTDTVQIIPLATTSNEEIQPSSLNSDQATLKDLIEQHYQHTRSSYAQMLLKNWTQAYKKFIKVIPKQALPNQIN